MLDLLVTNGRVVTPQGVGHWDVGVQGERIAAVAAARHAAGGGARDRRDRARSSSPAASSRTRTWRTSISMHPDEKLYTLGPGGGHARDGLRRHHHPRRLLLRAAGPLDLAAGHRAARRALEGQLVHRLLLPRRAAGRAAHHDLRPAPGGDPAGLPELQGLHGRRAAAAPEAAAVPARLRAHPARDGEGRGATTGSWSCTPRTTTSSSSCTRSSARRSGRRAGNLPYVHNKLSEKLAFRRTITLADATGAAVYFVHTSAREGVEAVAEARAEGLPIYAETLHHYACFTADDYKTPRGFCYHTYPSLKFPEDQDGALGRARAATACRPPPPTSSRRRSS